MCGRFMFEPDQNPEIKKIFELADQAGYNPKTGEIFPTDETALIIAGESQVQVVSMKWGFPGFKPGQNIINARSETVGQKAMFAKAFLKHRCVYPTTGFFEWSAEKNKFRFNYSKQPETLYIAGCFDYFQNVPHSVLFTTKPNESMIKIHDRMPLIIRKDQINRYIYDDAAALEILKQDMPQLNATQNQ